MKKRALSLFMALVLCLSLLPVPAWAEEAEHDIAVQAAGDAVAEVTVGTTTTQYTDFSKAAEKATETNGCTLKLLADTEVSEALTLAARTNTWTFDLNGKTLTQSGTASDDGFLTFYSGTVTIVDNVGTGKVIGVNRAIYASSNITLNITGGTFVGKNSNGLMARSGASVNLSGGTFYTENENEPHSIWYNTNNVKNLLTDGYRYQNADGAASGFGGKYASTDWYQGVVGWTTIAPIPEREIEYINANGSTAVRDTFTVIEAGATALTAGWYAAEGDITVTSLDVSGEVNLILCDGATLTVSGGLTVGSDGELNLYFQENGTGKLTAGVVNGSNITAPAGEMKATNASDSTTFEKCLNHKWEESASGTLTCSLCGATRTGGFAATLYPNDSTDSIPYPTFEEALSAAKKADNSILMLMADVTTTEMITISEGTFTLDLHGKSLTCTDSGAGYALTVSDGAVLSILDTGDGGTIKGPDRGVHVTGGMVRISGGMFIGVQSYGLLVEQGCDVKLSGGTFYSESENEENSIWVTGTGKAGDLLESGYGYRQEDGSLSEYDALGNGVKGKTTVTEGEAAEIPEHKHELDGFVCKICNQEIVAYTSHGDDINYYVSLNEAFEQVADGGMISTMASKITETVTFDRESSIRLKSLDIDYLQSTSQKDATLTVSAGELTLVPTSSEVTAPFHINNFGGGSAVLVTGPTDGTGSGGRLILNGKVYFNGGLKVTGTGSLQDSSASVKTGLAVDSILEKGAGAFSVSVEDSMRYKNVLGLLPDGYAFAEYDTKTQTAGDIISGNVEKLTENVIVVAHKNHTIDQDTKLCECGFRCDHEGGAAFVNGVCSICGAVCEHGVIEATTGKCGQCGLELEAEVSNSNGYLRGYTMVSEAIRNAPDGSKVTLLKSATLENGVTVQNTNGIELDLSGYSLSGNPLYVGSSDVDGNAIHGKLTVVDSGNGDSQIYLEVKDGGELIFNPGNVYTAIQLNVYGGTVRLMSGRIKNADTSVSLYNNVKMTDLLPEGYAYHYYLSELPKEWLSYENASQNNIPYANAYDLVPELCGHADVDTATGICRYCNAGIQAKVTVTSGSSTTDTLFPTLQEALLSDLVQNTANAGSGGSCTVTLLQDLDMGSDALLLGNGNYTLDLGGHEVKGKGKCEGNDNYLLAQQPGNGKIRNLTITIQNGKLTCSGNLNFAVQFSCNRGDSINVTLNVNVVGGVLAYNNVNLKLTGGTYQANPNWNASGTLWSYNGNLSGLLAEGMLFWGADGKVLDLSSVDTTKETVTVRACEHKWQDSVCSACGLSCTHSKDNVSQFENGVCKVCGYVCPHTNVEEQTAVCTYCSAKMAVKVTKGDTTTYYAKHFEAGYPHAEDTLKQVFNNAASGSTITLLADGLYASAWVTDKSITLDLNGKNLIENNGIIAAEDEQTHVSGKLTVTGHGSSTTPEDSGYPCTFRVRDDGELLFDDDFSGEFGTIYVHGGTLTSTNEDRSAINIKTLDISNSGATISFNGGAFDEICFSSTAGGNVTAGSLLQAGYAFQYQNTSGSYVPYNTMIDGSNSVKNVTIVTCQHAAYENGACRYCNYSCPHEHIIGSGDDYSCSACGVKMTVRLTHSDKTEEYFAPDTLADVLEEKIFENNIADGDTVTLLADGLKSGSVSWKAPDGTTATLNLNGHTLDGENSTITILEGSTLRVVGSGSYTGAFYSKDTEAVLDLSGWTGGTIYAVMRDTQGSKLIPSKHPGTKINRLRLFTSDQYLRELDGGTYGTIFPMLSSYNTTAGALLIAGYAFRYLDADGSLGDFVPYNTPITDESPLENVTVVQCPHELKEPPQKANVVRCEYCNKALGAVLTTADGTHTAYSDLDDVLTAAKKNPGCTVTMYTDGSRLAIVGSDARFTLDVNGYTLRGYNYGGSTTPDLSVESGANVTVKNAEVSSVEMEQGGIYVDGSSTLTLVGSTIQDLRADGAVTLTGSTVVTGTITASSLTVNNSMLNGSVTVNGRLTFIEGGASGKITLGRNAAAEFRDPENKSVIGELDATNAASLTISGGYFGKITAPSGKTMRDCLADGYVLWQIDSQGNSRVADLTASTLEGVSVGTPPITAVTAENPTITVKYGESYTLKTTIAWAGSTSSSDVRLKWEYEDGENLAYLHEIMPTLAGYETNSRTIDFPISKENGRYPTTIGTRTYVVTFTKDGYSKSCTFTVTIEKSDASVTKAPTAIENLTYTGEAQALLTAGAAEGGTMQYSLSENGTYSETIPTGTEAKEYTVWYKVVGDENHEGIEPQPITVTIAPKVVDNPAIEVTPGSAYNGKEQTPTVTVKDGNTIIDPEEYTVTYSNNVSAGTGTVTITDKEGGNYTVSGSAKFNIAKAKAPTLIAVNHAQKYTVTDGTVSLGSAGMPTDAGTLTYAKGAERVDHVSSWSVDSSGNVTYMLTGGQANDTVTLPITIGSANYENATVNVVITLTDRDAPAVSAARIDAIYTGGSISAQAIRGTATFGGQNVAGTWSWKGDPARTNVSDSGEKTVIFTPTDGINYKPVETTLQLTIAPAALTNVSVQQTGALTYNGQLQTADVTASAAAVNGQTVTFTYSDRADGTYSKTVPAFTDAGEHTVYFKASAPNHETATGSFTVTIAKADPICAAPSVSAIYGQTLHELTLTNPSGNTPGAWTWMDDAQSVGNAGEKTFTAAFAPNDAKNYNGKSGIAVTVTVAKAASTVSAAPTANTLTYTGVAQALITAGTTADGTLVYSLSENGDYSDTIPTGTKAGEYTVWYKVVGDSNHNDSAPASVSVTIARQPVAIPAADATQFIYNGAEQTYTVAASEHYTVAGSVKRNAGTHTVTVTLSDAENFVWSDSTDAAKTFAFVIAKAPVTITVKDKSAYVGNTAPDLTKPEPDKDYTVSGLIGDDKLTTAPTLTYDPAAPDLSKTGDAAAIKADGASAGENYAITYVDGKLTVTVRPSSGGGGSTTTSTETTTNPDGSVTKTETKSDGTVIETTTNKDGSTTKTETKTETKSNGTTVETVTETRTEADGSKTTGKTETTTNKDGSVTESKTETSTAKDGTRTETKSETKTDASGVTSGTETSKTTTPSGSTGTTKTTIENGVSKTEAEAKVSDKDVSDAKKSGEAVKVPTEVTPGEDSASAPTVKIDLPANAGETKIEIPVKDATPGTVAVIVKPDGTEEIVKDSVPTEDGIQLTVSGDVTVKIVDNAKGFTDTKGHWAEASIDFVSARGLVNGTSERTYEPDAATTRAQLWTILARQAGADLTGGSVWYEKAQAWAKASGISDGFNPDGVITRAQMVTMLYRAAGSPKANGTSVFTDVPAGSYYAEAVAWAVEHGITTGVGDGKFAPDAACTRAQIATFLHRSCLSK